MNISQANIKRVRELLKEMEKLEEAMEVMKNYDSKVFAVFWTAHNDNKKTTREVMIPVSKETSKKIIEEVKDRIFAIQKELEQL